MIATLQTGGWRTINLGPRKYPVQRQAPVQAYWSVAVFIRNVCCNQGGHGQAPFIAAGRIFLAQQSLEHRSGRPIYKSEWSDAKSVANAIDYFLEVMERRRNKEILAPFHVERLDYRNQDQQAFYAGLERNGPKAIQEFREAFS